MLLFLSRCARVLESFRRSRKLNAHLQGPRLSRRLALEVSLNASSATCSYPDEGSYTEEKMKFVILLNRNYYIHR